MDPSLEPVEINYETILKAFVEKGDVTAELKEEKTSLDSRFWMALRDYYESKSKYEGVESIHNDRCNENLKDMEVNSSSSQIKQSFDKHLEKIQQRYIELENKNLKQMETFNNDSNKLAEQFQELSSEFNADKMQVTIQNCKQCLTYSEDQLIKVKNEIDMLQTKMASIENMNSEISTLAEIRNVAQKESAEKFGDPTLIQICLSRLRNSINAKKNSK